MRGGANTRSLVLAAGFVGLVTGLSLRNDDRAVAPAAAGPVYTSQSKAPGIMPVYYSRCADAWAAGAAPIRVGEPGYREGLDGDSDGIACEPVRH